MSSKALSPFEPDAVSDEIKAQNKELISRLERLPDKWAFPPADIRKARLEGKGPFPLAEPDPAAEIREIDGPHGSIPLRIMRPSQGACRGVYFHIHGGGWVLGTAAENDPRNRRIADQCGLAVVSVDYRLAPEHPYPQGPDDCEAAACWLIEQCKALFDTDILLIGGESAGAHLAVVTLLRLRDRHNTVPFRAANLVAGCYDLTLTPSVRNWGTEPLIINTRDVQKFVENFLKDDGDPNDADISPLYADLTGLPPALFSVGTRDLLLDDSLFMVQRWQSAGLQAALEVYPGGCHVFQAFTSALSEDSQARMDLFLKQAVAG
ncbi:alpha/beta hydrolase [Coralliovum pocilloporae]|uniref:alpha/beta hydrolase n=1 Tax=Coralliovum pocilloporae TaxID=3066369 RepID=UPI003307B79A